MGVVAFGEQKFEAQHSETKMPAVRGKMGGSQQEIINVVPPIWKVQAQVLSVYWDGSLARKWVLSSII